MEVIVLNILVTGSEGFLGKKLVKVLEAEGHNVIGLDKKNGDNLLNLKPMKKVIDVVYHTAAMQPENVLMDMSKYLKQNLLATENLLKNCTAEKYIYTSSFSVYGKPEYLPMDEEHPTNPINPYGFSKLMTEYLFNWYERMMGYEVTVLRIDGIYGHGATIKGLINNMIDSKKPIKLFNDGEKKRNYVYINDVVSACVESLLAPTGVYNIGGGKPLKLYEIAERINNALEDKVEVILSDEKPIIGYDSDVYMDIDKAQKYLNYQPSDFNGCIEEMLDEKNPVHNRE